MLRRAMRLNPFRRRKPKNDAGGQSGQGEARRGWSQEFEYREPKNDGGNKLSAIFIFQSSLFDTELFHSKARKFIYDEKFVTTLDENRQRIYKENIRSFRDGYNADVDLISDPYSSENKGAFDVIGYNYTKYHKYHHIYFKRLGYRCVEFTHQLNMSYVMDYNYMQATIKYFKMIFSDLEPVFGFLDTYDYVYSFKQKKDPQDYVFGLTFYGKEMVAQIGREKLLSAPTYKVEEFDHGGIMLQIHENPVSYIAWPYRRKIMNHLGLKPRKLARPEVPAWLQQTKPPSRVCVPLGREVAVFVGLNADEIELGEDLSLYHHFYETVFSKYRGDAAPEFAFMKWFNNLDTGLETFVTGTEFEYEFKVFVGRKVTHLKGLDAWQKRVAPDKVEAAHERVAARFRELGFTEEPYLNLLLFHGEGI